MLNLERLGVLEEFEDEQEYRFYAKFLKQVPADGNCLFHAVQAALEAQNEGGGRVIPGENELRWLGTEYIEHFYENFATAEEKEDLDRSIRNFYFPSLDIDWGLDGQEPILSDKDAAAPAFADFDSPFEWVG